MICLTQILVQKREALRNRLVDSYAWHRALWNAFPSPDGSPRPFLSRVDNRGQSYRIYLLSNRPPIVQPWGEWRTREIPNPFFNHTHYRFDLRANPTTKRVIRNEQGERKKNGQRTAIYNPDRLNDWLIAKARQHGFEVLNVDIGAPLSQTFRRKNAPGKHVCVDFQGVLQVNNREQFIQAFQNGIGPAKSFGLGMLVLQPMT